jgi:UDP-N-acetyl-D-galactosamine dehydrogenase
LKFNEDFFAGYSPERINPGDKLHTVEKIKKVTSGSTPEIGNIVNDEYASVITAGTHLAPTMKVAEAAKVIENSQRDINIAFMNELSIIFNKMGIDTKAVLNAAGTKWNFLKFFPGIVGGHCIGVDPYYLTYKAEQLGYHSQIILSGRRINDDMGKYIAEQTVKQLIAEDVSIKNAKVGVLGITFKENCPDARNSKVNDVIKELKEYGINPIVVDPVADAPDTKRFYGIDLAPIDALKDLDCLIIAVAHEEFAKLSEEEIAKFFKANANGKKIIVDVKGILDRKEYEAKGYAYWRL